MIIFLALFRAYYLRSITVNVFTSCWTTQTEHPDRCTFLVLDELLRLEVVHFVSKSLVIFQCGSTAIGMCDCTCVNVYPTFCARGAKSTLSSKLPSCIRYASGKFSGKQRISLFTNFPLHVNEGKLVDCFSLVLFYLIRYTAYNVWKIVD